MAGMVIDEAHPAMFRARPFWFISCIILILVFRLGVLPLLHWYIHTRQTALTVTRLRAALREGHPEQGSHLSLAQARPRRARDARVPEPYSRRWDYPNLDRGRSAGVHGGGHAGPWHDQRNDLESAEPRRGLGPACRARTTIAIRRGRHGSCSPRRSRSSCWSQSYGADSTTCSRQARSQECGADFFRRLSRRDVMAVVSGGRRFLIFFVIFWLMI